MSTVEARKVSNRKFVLWGNGMIVSGQSKNADEAEDRADFGERNTWVGEFSRRCCYRVAMLLFVSTVAACATISHGSTQSIRVVSEPPGAQVTVDTDPVPYTAPATITLKRGQDHVLVFRKEGFSDYSAELTRSASGAVFGNLILGGVSGLMTDYGSGAAYELGHANLVGDTLTVKLIPRSTTSHQVPNAPLSAGLASESANDKGASSPRDAANLGGIQPSAAGAVPPSAPVPQPPAGKDAQTSN